MDARVTMVLLGILFFSTGIADSNSPFDSTVTITRDSHPKISSAIYDLLESSKAGQAVQSTDDRVQALSHSRVRVFIELADQAQGLPKGYGIEAVSQNDRTIEAWVPIERLEAIAALDDVRFIDAPQNTVGNAEQKPVLVTSANDDTPIILLGIALAVAAGAGIFALRKTHRRTPGKKH